MGVYDDDDLEVDALLLLICPALPHYMWIGSKFQAPVGWVSRGSSSGPSSNSSSSSSSACGGSSSGGADSGKSSEGRNVATGSGNDGEGSKGGAGGAGVGGKREVSGVERWAREAIAPGDISETDFTELKRSSPDGGRGEGGSGREGGKGERVLEVERCGEESEVFWSVFFSS
jgi:hypothetical protein